jgi:hypothetical protein
MKRDLINVNSIHHSSVSWSCDAQFFRRRSDPVNSVQASDPALASEYFFLAYDPASASVPLHPCALAPLFPVLASDPAPTSTHCTLARPRARPCGPGAVVAHYATAFRCAHDLAPRHITSM